MQPKANFKLATDRGRGAAGVMRRFSTKTIVENIKSVKYDYTRSTALCRFQTVIESF